MLNIPSGKQKCENLKLLRDPTEKKESELNEFSLCLPNKTIMFSEVSAEMEQTQVDLMVIHGLPKPEIHSKSAGIEKTFVLETDMDVTKSNTVFIDQEFKVNCGKIDHEITKPSSLGSPASSNCEGTVSDHKPSNTEYDKALEDQYIMQNDDLLTNSQKPSVGTEIIPLGVHTAGDHKSINAFPPVSDFSVPSEPSNSCASKEQKTVSDYICSQQAKECVPEKTTEPVEGHKVTKKHRLSKRVSFCVPEKECVGESVEGANAKMTLQNKEKLLILPNDQSDTIQYKPGNMNEQTEERSLKFDTDKMENGCVSENSQLFTQSVAVKNVFLCNKDVSEKVANCEEDVSSNEVSQKEKHRRRTIADIHLKIRSLTEKSKKRSSNHTAPVSCPANEPSTQTINSVGGDCIPEQTLLKESVSIKDTKTNENDPKLIETTKELCLQNRLSVNILHPKLPNKRQSSTCNLKEVAPLTISKPSTRTSLRLLKAFTDCNNGPCIDEEMLPACPDDQDGNSLFQYEVPEGAWEELCEEEDLHKNQDDCSSSKETVSCHKRARDNEDDNTSHTKRVRRNDDPENEQTSVGLKSPNECSRSDYSSHHTSKTMEQTYSSSSSQDSRGEGMSELVTQQYSQIDSQLPWDNGCGQNLWQKLQDGTITVKEFFMLLRIRILIQKPRYSELPVNRGNYEALSPTDLMLDRFVYQPKLQVYEEECHRLYQITEELKLYTNMQEKPLIEVNSLLWEAMRMCSENELMCFGMTLKNLKSVYSKKSKILAHEGKVSIYSKLLHKAQAQVVEVKNRITETRKLLEEVDDCISSLQIETATLEEGNKDDCIKLLGDKDLLSELQNLRFQEQVDIGERSHLETRKENALTHLGCLQDKAQSLEKHLEESCLTEWDMDEWTDTNAKFVFLYDSLELTIMFGEEIDGVTFNNQPCRRISWVNVESLLQSDMAPPSSRLVHKLILQFIEKKGHLHETYKMQNDVPQLLFDVSLVVSRCKLLGEEVEYLMKWGAKYSIVKTQVEMESNEVKLLFSSSKASAKFELCVQISEMYPEVPLSITVLNRIGNLEYKRVAAVISEVPLGLWLLKRVVRSLYENLLV